MITGLDRHSYRESNCDIHVATRVSMNAVLLKRFSELCEQLGAVEATKYIASNQFYTQPQPRVDDNTFLNWKVKAKNLLERACGAGSQHYREFVDNENLAYLTNLDVLGRLKAIFLAAKEDFEGGHLTSLRDIVQSEIFDLNLIRPRNSFVPITQPPRQ